MEVPKAPTGAGSGAPEKFFDFVLRNVELLGLCILDSGAGRQYNNCNHDAHDIECYLSFTTVSLCWQMSPLLSYHVGLLNHSRFQYVPRVLAILNFSH